MDAAQWSQEIGLIKPSFSSPPFTSSPSMEGMIMVPSSSSTAIMTPQLMERRERPRKEQQSLPCPRCNSTNTKFCYYNNYSLTQPRYFCKSCRRYWTEGGSLRNVPVGGGSRKNKKSMNTTTTTTTATNSSSTSDFNLKKLPDPTSTQVMNPSFYGNNSSSINNQSSSARSYVQVQDGYGSEVLYPNGGGFGFQSFLSDTVNFPMVPKMLPFENLVRVPQVFDQSRDQGSEYNSSGFWNGVVGGSGNSW